MYCLQLDFTWISLGSNFIASSLTITASHSPPAAAGAAAAVEAAAGAAPDAAVGAEAAGAEAASDAAAIEAAAISDAAAVAAGEADSAGCAGLLSPQAVSVHAAAAMRPR